MHFQKVISRFYLYHLMAKPVLNVSKSSEADFPEEERIGLEFKYA